ncbi:esterase FE4-like [Euwallacea fornicatus]|uniref:esterase FE4-like n=1 Tax=Euwallacea fornicatus TaxID=995702 RepID=UPI00338F970D
MLQVFEITVIYLLIVVNAIVVDLPDGKIEGLTNTTLNGTPFHSFLALRYAEPPVGSLRYKPPEPVQPWNDTYNATTEKSICYQLATNSDLENEDCLFLNVFTPKNLTSFAPDLAVLAWIHGGGFVSGSGYMSFGGFGPKFFMDSNVVLVTLNYRLGAFGFLSTGDEVISGNFGLKDQVLALKWIRKNIKYFGGDPEKITIFGQSSGGSSVGYHLLSPLSKGLYRAAILQSGSSLSPMAYQRNQTDYTYKTIKLLDPEFTSTNSTEILQYLQSLPASKIDKAASTLTSETETPANYQISKGFFYSASKEVCHDGAFLTELQYQSFLNGQYSKVPILIGNTDEESLGLVRLGDLSFLENAYDSNPSILVPFDMNITNNSTLKDSVGGEILGYFGRFAKDRAKLIKYHSMHDLDKGNIKLASLMAAFSTVYFYQFSYSGKMGNNPYAVPGTGKVAHSEDLNYIFSRSYSEDIPDNSDLSKFERSDQMVHFRMMELWTNFAKYLNPTPGGANREMLQNTTWFPIDETFRYLKIDEYLSMQTGLPKAEAFMFWNYLYDKYAVPPLDSF